MAYGELKVDSITFTDGGSDTTVSVSGLVQNPTFSGNITVTGTISGSVVQGGTLVSGATVSGAAGEFGTITGNTAGFTTVTGTTVTGTTANFVTVSGTTVTGNAAQFTTLTGGTAGFTTVTGTTITGGTGQFTTITGNTAGFTTVTGTTVTGTTANFATLSGATVTGNAGQFTTLTTTTANITSGVFASGTAGAPSVSVGTTDNGIYSPGTDQVAISTNGTGRLFVDSSGRVGVGAAPIAQLHSSATLNQFLATDSATNDRLYLSVDNGVAEINTFFSTTGRMPLRFMQYANEVARFDASGRLGLGTSAPQSLFVLRQSGGPVLTLEGTTANNNDLLGQIKAETSALLNSDNPASIRFYSDGSSGGNHGGYVSVWTNPLSAGGEVERVRITSTGRVGVGTTSPTALVDVAGANFAGGPLIGARYNTANFRMGIGTGNLNGFPFLGVNVNNSASSDSGTFDINGWANRLRMDNGNTIFERSTASGTAGGGITWTESVRIDSSSRLLVGTSSARSGFFGGLAAQTQIEGNSTATASFSITRNDASADGNALILAKARSTSYGIVVNGDRVGRISFQGADGTTFVPAATIEAYSDGTPGANDMPGRLVFSTTADGASSPTERMRIRNEGGAWIYGDPAGVTIWAANSRAGGAGDFVFYGSHSATGIGTGTVTSRIATNGDITNTNNSYGAISDVKLKENIVEASSQWDDLKALQIRKYNFKEETGQNTHTQIGLIAQEVELVSPGLVTESHDRDAEGNDLGTVTKSVNYSVLYMKAVKALQEAMERIETLEAKVAALESA